MRLTCVRTERWISTGLGAGLNIVAYPPTERAALIAAFTALAEGRRGPLDAVLESDGRGSADATVVAPPVVAHATGYVAAVDAAKRRIADLEAAYERLNADLQHAETRVVEIDRELAHAGRADAERQSRLSELAAARERLRGLSAERAAVAAELVERGVDPDHPDASRGPDDDHDGAGIAMSLAPTDPGRLADVLVAHLDRLISLSDRVGAAHPVARAAAGRRRTAEEADRLWDELEMANVRPQLRAELDQLYGELRRVRFEVNGARPSLAARVREAEIDERVRELLGRLGAATYADVLRQPMGDPGPVTESALVAEREVMDFWLHELVHVGADGNDEVAEAARETRRHLQVAGEFVGSAHLGPYELVNHLRSTPAGSAIAVAEPAIEPSHDERRVAELVARLSELDEQGVALRSVVDRLRLQAAGTLGTALRSTSMVVDDRLAERSRMVDLIDTRRGELDACARELDDCQAELRILDARLFMMRDPRWLTILSEPGRAVVDAVAVALHATQVGGGPISVVDPTLVVDATEASLLLDDLEHLAVDRQIIVLTDDPAVLHLDRPGHVGDAASPVDSDVG